jgi:hypothetical protein
MVESYTTYYEVVFKDRSVVDPTAGYTSAAGRGGSLSLNLKGDRYYDIMLLAGTDDRVLLATAFANWKNANGFADYLKGGEGYLIEAGKMNVIDLVLTPLTINPFNEEDPTENEFLFTWKDSTGVTLSGVGNPTAPVIGRNTPEGNLAKQREYLTAAREQLVAAQTALSTLVTTATPPTGVTGESIAYAIWNISEAVTTGGTIATTNIPDDKALKYAIAQAGDLNFDGKIDNNDIYANFALQNTGLADGVTDDGEDSTGGAINIYDVIYAAAMSGSVSPYDFADFDEMMTYASRNGSATSDINRDRKINASDLIAQLALEVKGASTIYQLISNLAVTSSFGGSHASSVLVLASAVASAQTTLAGAIPTAITAAKGPLGTSETAALDAVDALDTAIADIDDAVAIAAYVESDIPTALIDFNAALDKLKLAVPPVYGIVKGQARTSIIEKAISDIRTVVNNYLDTATAPGSTILTSLDTAEAALTTSSSNDPLYTAMNELRDAAAKGQKGIDNYNKTLALEASYDMVLSLPKQRELPVTVANLELKVTLKDYLKPLIQAHVNREGGTDTAYTFPFYPARLNIDSFAQRSATTFSQFAREGEAEANYDDSEVVITYQIPRNLLPDIDTYAKLYVTLDYYPFGTRYAAQKWIIRNGLSNDVDNDGMAPDIYSSGIGGATFVIVGEGGAPTESELLLLLQ